jgi:hypothetical protein
VAIASGPWSNRAQTLETIRLFLSCRYAFVQALCGATVLAAADVRPRHAAAHPPTSGPAPTPEAIEREVLDNVRGQAIGLHCVEDLSLPEPFLRRVADRAIRASYEQRYRIVVPDSASRHAGGPVEGPGHTSTTNGHSGSTFWRWAGRIVILPIAILLARWALQARRKHVQ